MSRSRRVALVLTPVASAEALAGLCSMAGIDAGVVPASSGAIAVIDLDEPADAQTPGENDGEAGLGVDADGELVGDWDISALLGAGTEIPPAADELARQLSRFAKDGVILLTASLGSGDEITGQLSACRYVSGEPGDDLAVGLILASADDVVEDLALGARRADEIEGYTRSSTVPRWRAARFLAKGMRRRHRD